MSRKVTLTIEPDDGHHDVLTVQDAFQQAIDFFDLLTDEAEKNVIWKLEMASMNSPFSCQGEPIDTRTWAGAYGIVEDRIKIVEHNLFRVANGEDFDESFPREKVEVARRLLRRNTNGIGRSVAGFSDDTPPVEISKEIASRYFAEVIAPVESLHSYLFSRTSRREIGSIEGRLIDIGTDYDAPALQIEEHNTGRRLWCRVNPETLGHLEDELKAGDVWKHRRVRARGTLNYDDQGNVIRVMSGAIAYIDTPAVDLDKVEDAEFTEGYPVAEYLDRLREGEFGQ
jgi:hypothetical protein